MVGCKSRSGSHCWHGEEQRGRLHWQCSRLGGAEHATFVPGETAIRICSGWLHSVTNQRCHCVLVVAAGARRLRLCVPAGQLLLAELQQHPLGCTIVGFTFKLGSTRDLKRVAWLAEMFDRFDDSILCRMYKVLFPRWWCSQSTCHPSSACA